MPKLKQINEKLPAILRLHAIDQYLCVYVDCITTQMPSCNIQKAVELFKENWGLTEDDLSMETALK